MDKRWKKIKDNWWYALKRSKKKTKPSGKWRLNYKRSKKEYSQMIIRVTEESQAKTKGIKMR